MEKREEKGIDVPVKLQKKHTPELGPVQVEPRPAFLIERPGWPDREQHEAERARILDSQEVRFKVEDVARRYGLTVKWVYGCKRLQAIKRKAGKYCFWRLSDLIEFEESKVGIGRGYRTDVIRRDEPEGNNDTPVNPLKFDLL